MYLIPASGRIQNDYKQKKEKKSLSSYLSEWESPSLILKGLIALHEMTLAGERRPTNKKTNNCLSRWKVGSRLKISGAAFRM
jgi:hypothetical protein